MCPVTSPPHTPVESVVDVLHGISVSDPYRWLEDGNSPRTRKWIAQQSRYTRAYFDRLRPRARIRAQIREFLEVETYDSLQANGGRYFFRKRLPKQEQPCIYMRDGTSGEDQLLLDPASLGAGSFTSVKPFLVSPDGRLLVYEVKQGGRRAGAFKLLDVATRTTLPDALPLGSLRGLAFDLGSKAFYYVHDRLDTTRPFYRAAYRHVLGTSFDLDQEIFFAGEDQKIRLCLIADEMNLGFLVYRFLDKTLTTFHIRDRASRTTRVVVSEVEGIFGPRLSNGRVFAITNRDAPNLRICEARFGSNRETEWLDVVPESDARIQQWLIAGNHILVSYCRNSRTRISVFNLLRQTANELTAPGDETIRLAGSSPNGAEVFLESESFTEPIALLRYSVLTGDRNLWARRNIPFDPRPYGHSRVSFTSKDGTLIPMFLMGRKDVLDGGAHHPVIMTSYGGYGISMTPQFSVFVSFLVQNGCLFALPNIRGGAEFGAEWHEAAKRHNRQTAFDDFLSAAEWLVATGRTAPEKLAIFGGSNSGLLVGAAMTQRPDLFRAVVCMVPLLDMLRYHLFDNAHIWKEEYGSSDDPEDFAVLRKYSPYHRVREGTAYPATLIVSGDADGNCNPAHARKMAARLQSANSSEHPILLDYTKFRGHSPVLPLSLRVEALTDRMTFLCDQLGISV